MKRVSVNPWCCRTTSFHPVWTFLLIRVSTPTRRSAFRATHDIQLTVTAAAQFYLCDGESSFHTVTKIIYSLKTHRDWILHTSCFRYLTAELVLEELHTLARLNVKKHWTLPFTWWLVHLEEDREEETFYSSAETNQWMFFFHCYPLLSCCS